MFEVVTGTDPCNVSNPPPIIGGGSTSQTDVTVQSSAFNQNWVYWIAAGIGAIIIINAFKK